MYVLGIESGWLKWCITFWTMKQGTFNKAMLSLMFLDSQEFQIFYAIVVLIMVLVMNGAFVYFWKFITRLPPY